MTVDSTDVLLLLERYTAENLPTYPDSSKKSAMVRTLYKWLIENKAYYGDNAYTSDAEDWFNRINTTFASDDLTLITHSALNWNLPHRNAVSYVRAITRLVELVTPCGENTKYVKTHRFAHLLCSLMRSLQQDMQSSTWRKNRDWVCTKLPEYLRSAYTLNVPRDTQPILTSWEKFIQTVFGKTPKRLEPAQRLMHQTGFFLELTAVMSELPVFNANNHNYSCSDCRGNFFIQYNDRSKQWVINVYKGYACGCGVYDHEDLCAAYGRIDYLKLLFVATAVIMHELTAIRELPDKQTMQKNFHLPGVFLRRIRERKKTQN